MDVRDTKVSVSWVEGDHRCGLPTFQAKHISCQLFRSQQCHIGSFRLRHVHPVGISRWVGAYIRVVTTSNGVISAPIPRMELLLVQFPSVTYYT